MVKLFHRENKIKPVFHLQRRITIFERVIRLAMRQAWNMKATCCAVAPCPGENSGGAESMAVKAARVADDCRVVCWHERPGKPLVTDLNWKMSLCSKHELRLILIVHGH